LLPWKYYNSQCFRTMKVQHASTPEPAFQGTRHNALADAQHQARWLQSIWADLKDREAGNAEWKKAVKAALVDVSKPRVEYAPGNDDVL